MAFKSVFEGLGPVFDGCNSTPQIEEWTLRDPEDFQVYVARVSSRLSQSSPSRQSRIQAWEWKKSKPRKSTSFWKKLRLYEEILIMCSSTSFSLDSRRDIFLV